MNDNYIWLFGENVAKTSNNNSFYFWKHTVLINDGIEKYIVFEKNDANKQTYNMLSDKEKAYVVWKNSFKHWEIYKNADMFFVTLSYKDVLPDKFLFRKYVLFITKPLIYLQHGTLGIKSIGYRGNTYNNNMVRFVYYNKHIKPIFAKENDFKDYQLYYGEYLPRYKELVKRYIEYSATPKKGKQILWFPTWREYFGDNAETKLYTLQMNKIFGNKRLSEYLEKSESNLTVCLHQFFDEDKIGEFKENLKSDRIRFVHASQIDVLDEIAKNDLLITDYSSVGFDFTVLNKPVILYQPDLEAYLSKRSLYCELDELKKYSVTKIGKLIDMLVNEEYGINDFFKSRLPENIDFDYIVKGGHIDRMYSDFSKLQRNKVSFIGYNFYGIGGTVFATRSLAEALLEKNYLVELISVKCSNKQENMPYGLQLSPLYVERSPRKAEKIKKFIPKIRSAYGYLNYDCSTPYILPYANFAMKKRLSKIKSKTVVSTRESLHLYLNDASSDKIKNKIHFFHCSSDVINELFPEAFKMVSEKTIDKAVFVTDESRLAYEQNLGYKNYKDCLVLGNTLESSRSVEKDDIALLEKAEGDTCFRGIYLVRISPEREADLNNLIGFAEYLKKNNVDDITISVFGDGAYLDEFLNKIYDNELEDYIKYCGKTNNPKDEFENYDAVVDFTLNHSFGMPYIEAVLNGKMLYCTDNIASREVMEGIEGCIYTSYEDLLNKIRKFPEITEEQLKNNYEQICKKYSRDVLAKKFIEFMEK